MDAPIFCVKVAYWFSLECRSVSQTKQSERNATPVAVDLAKSVFQLAAADEHWRVVETYRLTRTQFERWFANRDVCLVILEACGCAHHWGRWLNSLGIQGACYWPNTFALTLSATKQMPIDADNSCGSLPVACNE